MTIIHKSRSIFPIFLVIAAVNSISGCKPPGAYQKTTDLNSNLDAVTVEIMPWIRDQITFVVSPDAKRMIIKNDINGGETELRLEDMETRKLLGRNAGGYPLLIAWRPNSKMISFVKDNQGDRNFRLMFWDPESDRIIVPDVPIISRADRVMRWSPNGRYLAFCVPDQRGLDELRILDVSASAPYGSVVVFEGRGILDFNWSPDGSRLAVASEDHAGGIRVIEQSTNQQTLLEISARAKFSDITWMPDSRHILVNCKEDSEMLYLFKEVDLEFGKFKTLFSTETEARKMFVLADGRVLFHVYKNGIRSVMINVPDAEPRLVGFNDGDTRIMAVNESGNEVWVDHTGPTRPHGLYRINITSGYQKLIFQPAFEENFRGVSAERVNISVPDDTTISINVWRSAIRPSLGVVINFPIPHYPSPSIVFNGACQYIIKKGYDYISFDIPSQQSGENTADPLMEKDVNNALAVIKYARDALGARQDKIALVGDSGGTLYVTETAARLENKTGALILRGVTESFQSIDKVANHSFRIAALQGENDPLPPSEAKVLVENIFGPNALSGTTGLFRVLDGEGHMPRQLRSKALITAAIVEVLASSQ